MSDHSKISSFYENGVFQDFYKLLEVSMSATNEEIKKNYRRLCKIYHPDFPTGDSKKMQQLGIAYGILKNQETRKLYDSYYLDHEKRNSSMSGAMNSNYTSTSHFNTNSKKAEFNNFNNYFSWSQIRNLLRKCRYSDSMIDGFIAWCQKNAISISSGSELSAKLREYNSLNYESNQIKRTYYEKPQQENRVFASSRYLEYPSVMDSMFYRQMMVRQMIVASLFNQYLENSFSFFPRVSNVQIYGIPPVRMVLYSYVPTSRVFYSRPKVKYYY